MREVSDPEKELLKIDSVSERIDVIAMDVETRSDRFAKINPQRLAELLGLDPQGFSETRSGGYPVAIEDKDEPVHYYLEHLDGKVSGERIETIYKESAAYEAGERDDDAELSTHERDAIEAALTEEKLENEGGEWLIGMEVVRSTGGVELRFEAEYGDGGDCFSCEGPYEFRDRD